MALVVTEEVTLADIDEAMKHIQLLLADSRLAPRRRNVLLESLDDLLDARLELGGSNGNTKDSVIGTESLSE
jgi:hypothetical protein